MEMDQKKLANLVKRRHPAYEENLKHWNFVESTYEGGRKWFADNIHRYHKEGDKEYKNRVNRAYRFNHSREVVNIVHKYVFQGEINRKPEVVESIEDFRLSATKNHDDIDHLMRQIDIKSSIFGRIWVVVDSVNHGSDPLSKADEKNYEQHTYAYIVKPQQMLDYAFDNEGHLSWCLISETGRDDSDPFESSGKEFQRFRLWTVDRWYLFRLANQESGSSKEQKVILEDMGELTLGVLPIFPVDAFAMSDASSFTATSLIQDVAYLDKSVANYLSNLDAIIQDQTFSQLAIPVQGLLAGDDDHKKVLEMGTQRIFTFDGEGGAMPFYMSPDVKQADLILKAIAKIINEIYSSSGIASERTKEDNSQGIDNSSGVAKAFDFQRITSLLVAKSRSLQNAENKICEMVLRWSGEFEPKHNHHAFMNDYLTDDSFAVYPKTFDTRGLVEEFAIAEKLALIQAPDEIRQEQLKMLVHKIMPTLSEEMRKTIEASIKTFPQPPIEIQLADKQAEQAEKTAKFQAEQADKQAKIKAQSDKVQGSQAVPAASKKPKADKTTEKNPKTKKPVN